MAPVIIKPAPTRGPAIKPERNPFTPLAFAPIIGVAMAVVTPPKTPLPVDFNPDEIPDKALTGFRVEKSAFFYPIN